MASEVPSLESQAMGETPSRPRISPLAALEHRDFRLLFCGAPFASAGLQMRSFANAFQVYQLTDSAALLGLTFLFQGIPALVTGLFGGTLADVFDRRLILKISVIGQILIALSLGLLTLSGYIQVWHIYFLTVAGSAIGTIDAPTRSALVPELVPQHKLMNAMSLQSTAGMAAGFAGALLGGVVVKGWGAAPAYFADATLILPALAAIWMLRVPPKSNRRKVKLNLDSIFEGLLFTLKNQVLFGFILLDTVTMVLGFYPAMMVVFAEEVLKLGKFQTGLLLSATALGSALGFLGVLFVGNLRRKGLVIVLVCIGHAIALFCFAVSPWFILSFALVMVLGFMDSLSVTVRSTSFQLLAPDFMRGRVFSVLLIAAVSSNAAGGAVLGVETEFLGPRHALAYGAIGAGAFAICVGVFWKKVRDYQS